mgnify:CR=1 FL=1
MIELGDNENIESAIKRFRKKCDRDGISRELKKRVHYEKPSLQRKKKIEALKRKLLKKQRRQQKNNY